MAAKKKAAPKRAGKKKSKAGKTALGTELKKTFLGVAILAALVVVAGIAAHRWLGSDGRGRPAPARQTAAPLPHKTARLSKPATPAQVYKVPKFEVFPKKEVPVRKPMDRSPAEKRRPKVAIIIDDMGYDRHMADGFCALDAPLTFSVLPFAPFRDPIVQKARRKGFALMLHLPMEPVEYPDVDPGPGALLAAMAPDRLIAELKKNLDAMPYAIGVNNHMGSRLTAQADQMNQIFTVLKRRRLFFIDSRTTMVSTARQAARLLQVPFSHRDVFLDHVQTPDFVRGQIRELIRVAAAHGEAVGIGHPHAVTLDILKEMLPALKSKVRLVTAAEVVHPVG
jgi:uncharacterized protein